MKWQLGLGLVSMMLGASNIPSVLAATQSIKLNGKTFKVNVPDGYVFELVSADLSNPRIISLSAAGDMVVGSQSGEVYRLKKPYQKVEKLVDFGGYPHSAAFRKVGKVEELWLADTNALYRVEYDSNKTFKKSDFKKIVDIPGGGGHSSRTVKVGPDNKIYVSLGISGNCSNEYLADSYEFSKRRGGIFILDESGTPVLKTYANGLRNPVGFDWEPSTNILYADNNGPDHWGFDIPQEVFVQTKPGTFHGMPWYQVIDGVVKKDNCIAAPSPKAAVAVELPVAYFPARSAPMDVAFIKKDAFDNNFAGSALVALHGSWATPPSGSAGGDISGRRHPKVVLVEFKDGQATGKVEDFITGFQLADGSRWMRPVGLIIAPGQALYISSDADNEGIYRLRKEKAAK